MFYVLIHLYSSVQVAGLQVIAIGATSTSEVQPLFLEEEYEEQLVDNGSTPEPSDDDDDDDDLEEGEFVPDAATLAKWCKIPEDQIVFDF